jgi:hypothetical protein
VKPFIRLPRTEILIIAGAALVAFVITLAVVTSGSGARAGRAAAEAAAERLQNKKPPALSAEELALSPEDFMLPSMEPVERSLEYVPFRPRLQRWSPALVDRFWIAPRDIATEIVGSINDQNMQQLFQKVP